MKKLVCRVSGLLPVIFHNGDLADPLNEFAKAMRQVSSKKKKTEADFAQLAKLEFMGGLYFDAKGRVIIPDFAIEACLVNAAKKDRKGKHAQAAIFASHAVLEYDGPRTREELWEDGRFRYSVGVRVGQSRVIRTRPKFNEWAAEMDIEFDDSLMNQDEIEHIIRTAGLQIGIGDRRPKFGRFKVDSIKPAKS